jgi:hypothetical protein
MGSLLSSPRPKNVKNQLNLKAEEMTELFNAYESLKQLSNLGRLTLKKYGSMYDLQIEVGRMTYRGMGHHLCTALKDLSDVVTSHAPNA